MNTPSTSISPGLGGFIAFFVLAVALWLLMRNMNARMRRMSYQAEEEARRAQEKAAGARPAPEGDGPVEGSGTEPESRPKPQTGSAPEEQTGTSGPT